MTVTHETEVNDILKKMVKKQSRLDVRKVNDITSVSCVKVLETCQSAITPCKLPSNMNVSEYTAS